MGHSLSLRSPHYGRQQKQILLDAEPLILNFSSYTLRFPTRRASSCRGAGIDYFRILLTSLGYSPIAQVLFSFVVQRCKNYGTYAKRKQPRRRISMTAGPTLSFPEFVLVFQALLQRLDLRAKIATELQPVR